MEFGFLRFVGRKRQNNKIWITEYPSASKNTIDSLNRILGYELITPRFFIKALTHRSYLEISSKLDKSYERLEYLGDAVLGLISAEYLFQHFSDQHEGFLTKTRSQLVNKDSLADAAERIDLKKFVLYDKRFLRSEDKGMRSILADCVEALIGAIYLDSGLDNCRKFIIKNIIEPSISDGSYLKNTNYKGMLLEFCHAKGKNTPSYNLIKEEGPEHCKTFTVEVVINEEILGTGEGDSKKTAEQNAAKSAFNILKESEKTGEL